VVGRKHKIERLHKLGLKAPAADRLEFPIGCGVR